MKILPSSRNEPGPSVSPNDERPKPAPDRQSAILTPGQLIKGRVVRVEENGRVLIAMNEELVSARTPLKLAEGSEHWLEVRRGGAEPWLALAGQKGAAGELLRLLAAEEGGRGKALELLLAGGGDRMLSPAASAFLQGVAALLAESATGGEADPAKVILALLLMQPFGTKEEGGPLRRRLADLLAILPKEAAARKGAEKLARIVTAAEELNGQPAAAGERFFIFPCLLAGSSGWGEWLLTLDHPEGAEGEPGYGLSFFLRLSRMGNLYVELAVRGGTVSGTFAAASAEARQHLEASLDDLTGSLQGLGFEQVRLACRPAERHLLQEIQEAIRRRAGMAPLALIDLRA